MASTFGELIKEHSDNSLRPSADHSSTNKQWAKAFASFKCLRPHVPIAEYYHRDYDPRHEVWISYDRPIMENYEAKFDEAFEPIGFDKDFRHHLPSNRRNKRNFSSSNEADIRLYFNIELMDPVLSGFVNIQQKSELKQGSSQEAIDEAFVLPLQYDDGRKEPVPLLVEIKRNTIRPDEWLSGELKTQGQRILSQELRGYAAANGSTQVAVYDSCFILFLQIRAQTLEQISDENVPVDCYILSLRDWAPVRYGIYRALLQGWRSCISWHVGRKELTLGRYSFHSREFYSGKPLWEVMDETGEVKYTTVHPEGYVRVVDKSNGLFYWSCNDEEVIDGNGRRLWDTVGEWQYGVVE